MGTHLVLAGGGHAHLFVLEGIARGRFPPGTRVTLVASQRRHAYSGMVPGLVGGTYGAEEILLDLEALARAAGAAFLEDRVVALDAASREVVLAGGARLGYDLLSLAIGSGTAGVHRPGVRELALFLKPIDCTLAIVPALERAVERSETTGPAVTIVGAGAAGVELAFAIRARLRRLNRPTAPVTLLDGGDRILADRSDSCRRLAETALAEAGVGVVLGSDVTAVEAGRLRLPSGATVRADVVVWATGPSAPDLFAGAGLATDRAGYLLVDRQLRSVTRPEIFAAGDAASLERHPGLPRAGVYAVREGPVLRDNLAAAAAGRPPRRRFRPQRRFLALLNTGDGQAILSYGTLALRGRWAMALKDRIDRRFVGRFRR